jgi:hypothetical protein
MKNAVSAMRLVFLLLLCIDGHSQTSFTDVVSRKFTEYVNSFPMEDIYVHTDRQVYVAGEDLWFKIYAFDRQSLKLLKGDGIVYFEILNPENRPVVQKRIKIVDGVGPGQIVLPDTLSSGSYFIRSYTNWMKNFMPYNCFLKRISVQNVLNSKGFVEARIVRSVNTGKQSVLNMGGITMNVSRSANNGVILDILSTSEQRNSGGILYYLFVQTRGTINYKTSVNLGGNITRVDIPGSIIAPGINQITLFNVSGRLITEKYIYTPAKLSADVNIISKDSCRFREKVSAAVEISRNSAFSEDLFASASVVPAGTEYFPDIADYLVFGSEFGDITEKITYSGPGKIQPDSLDKILSGLKSNWINWENILSGRSPSVRYKRETESHFLYGRLLNRTSQKPDSGQFVFLSVPGKNASFQYGLTDKNGEFSLSLPLDQNLRDLIIQPEDITRNNNLEIENSFSIKYQPLEVVKDRQVNNIPVTGKLGINYQVMKIYSTDTISGRTVIPGFTSWKKRFYGKPDIELVMDDYIKLPVMQEVFFELMPGVTLKKRRSEYEIIILDPTENRFFDKQPGLLIDGVIIRDPALIANLDPELVEKIDAVKARYFVGDYMFYGLVNVITRSGDFGNFALPDYAVRIPYTATGKVKTFSSVDYSSGSNLNSRLPDFRNTLYWNPDIRFGSDGKARIDIWTSDFRSDYELLIQGVSANGEFFTARKIIRVQ